MGDWKLLHILGMNMEPLVFGELVVELAEQMKDANHIRVEQGRGCTKTANTDMMDIDHYRENLFIKCGLDINYSIFTIILAWWI